MKSGIVDPSSPAQDRCPVLAHIKSRFNPVLVHFSSSSSPDLVQVFSSVIPILAQFSCIFRPASVKFQSSFFSLASSFSLSYVLFLYGIFSMCSKQFITRNHSRTQPLIHKDTGAELGEVLCPAPSHCLCLLEQLSFKSSYVTGPLLIFNSS